MNWVHNENKNLGLNKKEGRVVVGMEEKHLNLILYGPPGTGKTYNTAKYAIKILDKKEHDEVDDEAAWKLLKEKLKVAENEDQRLTENEGRRVEFITFHQSYSYEEFVEGLRPKITETKGNNENTESVVHQNNKTALTEYEIRPGVLKSIAKRATADWEKNKHIAGNYVLIIDEINRGDISRIFGEMITIIEEDKRLGRPHEIKIKLPYSGELFGLPPNLYIIGTMNSADRSIALIDIALRRRFKFEEFMPDYKILKERTGILEDGIDLSKMLEKMNNRIEFLYDRDHTLGHSYFLDVTDLKGLIEVFRDKIIPLLQEYFFDDWSKIDKVLGENKKILDGKELKINELFAGKNSLEFNNDKKLYQVNLPKGDLSKLSDKEEWAEAFKRIYEKK